MFDEQLADARITIYVSDEFESFSHNDAKENSKRGSLKKRSNTKDKGTKDPTEKLPAAALPQDRRTNWWKSNPPELLEKNSITVGQP